MKWRWTQSVGSRKQKCLDSWTESKCDDGSVYICARIVHWPTTMEYVVCKIYLWLIRNLLIIQIVISTLDRCDICTSSIKTVVMRKWNAQTDQRRWYTYESPKASYRGQYGNDWWRTTLLVPPFQKRHDFKFYHDQANSIKLSEFMKKNNINI